MTGSRIRIAAFATHPIQYHAPWYRAIVGAGADLRVHFSLLPDEAQQAVGFGGAFAWDTPILSGYEWISLPQGRRSPSLGNFAGLNSAGIGRILGEYSPDVVLLTGWNARPLLQALRAAIQLGIPTVVRGESNSMRPRPRWKEAGHRALLALYDGFISIGKANRSFYESNGVSPERIVDGGYFVDEEHFVGLRERELPRRHESRRSLGIPEGAFCALFAGKIEEKKRPLDFIAAIGAAARGLGEGRIHGLVVGSGVLESQARDLATSLGAPVTFTGFLNQSEIGRAYAAADALVLPSGFGETWGLVVNEGMLFGLPAVVSDRVGCGPDLVEDGATGFVFPFGDVGALAACVERLACDRSGRVAMGERARERVLGYSPARGARATIAAARLAMRL